MNILGIEFFLTHKHYGKRPASHMDAYRMDQGWWFVEVGSWTLEVEFRLPRLRTTLRAAALIAGTAAVLSTGPANAAVDSLQDLIQTMFRTGSGI